MLRPGLLAAALVSLVWVVRSIQENWKLAPRIIGRGHPLASQGSDEVSVTSYNVLSDMYAHRLQYCMPSHLAWSYRWPLLQQELASFQSDIICLQEVEISRWEEITSCAALSGYTGYLQEKQGGESAVMGVALFVSKQRGLRLVWRESRTRALLGALSFLDSCGQQQLLYIAVCHLEGSPYRPSDRVSQIRSVLERLQRHQADHNLGPAECPMLVVGDLNSSRKDSVCQLLHRGRLEGGSTSINPPHSVVTKTTLSHPFTFEEAYKSTDTDLPFTHKTPSGASTLDYIWYSSLLLSVVAIYQPLDAKGRGLLSEDQAMPNQIHPSDHLPIGAIFRVRDVEERWQETLREATQAQSEEALPTPVVVEA